MFEIIIKDLKLYGYHGVKPEEKKEGQHFLFNISLSLAKNTFKNDAGLDDDISATVNYSEVISLVKEINRKNKYDLLETLCEVIASNIIECFPMVFKVKVRVEKTNPPIKEDIKSVGVEVLLKRHKNKNYNISAVGKDFRNVLFTDVIFYLCLGSNLNDREKNLRDAMRMLTYRKNIKIAKVSSIYESEPMYVVKQNNFYNIVLKGSICFNRSGNYNNYSAFEFLGFLKSIEHSMGRKAFGPRYGPRIIDLDLLYYDGQNITSDILTLPHPGMPERKFVLEPFNEIEPDLVVNGKKISELLQDLPKEQKVLKLKEW
ncbi:MAG: 2-amino-4-hydroxy-6-hydroxymethyldihydropteridine diphosphokinase [Actinobacteria bacterium]|nr:2-amino-4-hydroxy-6-hydroxymethyldihydropteridine diphosphokinase [Actinomycetota bacterium]